MAEFGNDNNKVSGVFGGVQFDNNNNQEQAGNFGNLGTNYGENAGTI